MIRNDRPLVLGIINALLFLEMSGDDEVDPDSAVRCMENIAANLLTLDRSDQLALRWEFMKIADDSQDKSYGDFVRSLPEAIGLEEP